MTEDFDNLLAIHHLLDETIQSTNVFLLCDEELSTLRSGCLAGPYDKHHHYNGDKCQRHTQDNHVNQHVYDTDQTVDKLRDTLADHLTQGINIVCVHGHDIAMLMCIKIFNWKRFHMFKHVVTDISHRSLSNIHHDLSIAKGCCNTDCIQDTHLNDGLKQIGIIWIFLTEKWRNVAIDQCFHKHRSLCIGIDTDENADQHKCTVNWISL